jgi:hypothetical protein
VPFTVADGRRRQLPARQRRGAAGASGKIGSGNDGLASTRRGRAWRPGGQPDEGVRED